MLSFDFHVQMDKNEASRIETELQNKRKELLDKLDKQRTQADLNKLQSELQNLFYGDSPMQSEFNRLLAEGYESVTQKKLKDFNIGDSFYRMLNSGEDSYKLFKYQMENQMKNRKDVRTITLRNANKLIKDLETMLASGSEKILAKKLNEIYIEAKTAIKGAYEEYIGQGYSSDSEMLLSRSLGQQKDLRRNLQELLAIRDLLQQNNVLIAKDYGDILEYGLQLFAAMMAETSFSTADELTDEMIKKIESQTKQIFSLTPGSLYVDRISFTRDKKSIPIGSKDVKEETLQIGNAKVTYYLYTDSKQGKMDVQMEVPTENGQKVSSELTNLINISAKNWRDAPFTLGSTDILNAITRTLGEVSQTYNMLLLSLQTPDGHNGGIRKAGMLLSQLCCLLDIVNGFSQQTNYANVLIINNRRQKKILVVDIPQLIRDAFQVKTGGILSFGQQAENAKFLKIENFDFENKLYNAARGALEEAVRQKANRTDNYIRSIESILRTIQIHVMFNG